MREASAKGPAIDLTEFERRLRGPEPAKRSGHDPLAELARLLHGNEAGAPVRDPYRDVFAEEPPAPAPRVAPRVPQPQRPSFNEDDFVADLRASFEPPLPNPPASQRRPAPQQRSAAREFQTAPEGFEAPERFEAPRRSEAPERFEAPRRFEAPEGFEAPRRSEAPERFEAPRRSEAPPERFEAPRRSEARQRFEAPERFEPPQRFEAPRPRHGQTGFHDPNAEDWGNDESQSYLDYGAQEDEQDDGYEHGYYESEPRPNRLKIGLVVVGIIVLGGVSIGWGFAHRGGGGAPQEIATIAAPDGPAKVPPAAGEEQQEQQGAAVLDRNESATVRNVVAHEEQPVDPTAATRGMRVGAGEGGDAAAADNAPPVQEPRKVKTVSVRPDGTVIANDAAPAAAVAVPRPARAAARDPAPDDVAQIQGGTPKNAAAPPPATTPRTAKPAKPAKVAVVETPPPSIVENEDASPAPSDGAADPAPASGAFAVQFGAAASEAEARAVMESVMAKYGPQLGGRRLGYRHAKVGEKSVYRIRVGGVGKESAVAICEKVKAAGGNCFVAPN